MRLEEFDERSGAERRVKALKANADSAKLNCRSGLTICKGIA